MVEERTVEVAWKGARWPIHVLMAPGADAAGRVPVLFLHGIGSGAASFAQVLAAVGGERAALAWDAPGYGQSDDPPLAPEPADYGHLVDGLCRQLGLSAVVLVGHSFGAVVAAETVKVAAERVRAVVLVDAALGDGAKPESERKARLAERERMIREWGPVELARRRTRQILSPGAAAAVVAQAEAVMAQVREAGYVAAARALAAVDEHGVWRGWRKPAAIFWGGLDEVTPLSLAHALALDMPQARWAVFPRSGHLSYAEAPEAFVARLKQFLHDLDDAPAATGSTAP